MHHLEYSLIFIACENLIEVWPLVYFISKLINL